jgi:AcrR family transcriptional regulator
MSRTQTRSTPEPHSERRDQLLAIAARLIASRGYAATTVRDIADEAGILSGSLYHHFASKEAILEEILRSFMDGLLQKFNEIEATGGSPREVLDGLIGHAFATIDSQHDSVGLYQNESSFLAKQPGFEFVANEGARIEKIFLTAIRNGQRDGVFRANLDAAVAYRFIRDAVWSTVRWYRPEGNLSINRVRDDYLDFLHNGLLEA